MRIPFARRPAAAGTTTAPVREAGADSGAEDEAEDGTGAGGGAGAGRERGRADVAGGGAAAARDGGRGGGGPDEGRSPRARRRARGVGRSAAAFVLGALPALAFPAPGLWWWAFLALVPWLLLIRSAPDPRRAGYDGWCGGFGFMLAMHHWLLPSLHVFLPVIAALLGLLWLPWARLVRAMLRGTPSPRRAAAALFVVPSGWLLIELVRSWQGLGGPWGLLGASQWQVPAGLRIAAVGGVWLVTLLVVAVNTAVALLVAVPRLRQVAVAGLVGCALVAGLAWWAGAPPRGAGSVRIAVVQPGVVGPPGERFDRGEALTRPLAGQRLDLVVWGESSVGADLVARPDFAARLAALSRAVDAPLLVNVDARRSDRPGIFKSAILVGPDGPTGERYDKMRLVPFGEYVPARAVLGWATSVGKAAGEDRRRGTAPVVMTLPGTAGPGPAGLRIGPLICFETAFPDMSRRLARDGADVIVAQSSTSTFQDSWAPAQHASLGALRAAETGRPVVHATLSGVSAAYGPDGRRIGPALGTGSSTVVVHELPLARGGTPYERLGDWAVYGAVAVVVLVVLVCLPWGGGSGRFRRDLDADGSPGPGPGPAGR
ncbi:apolipoprotein N-acyltransferase [Streptomyces sp. NPDC101115]|uniref:apolipoprotein N-acyltransferase n=1 Tax=Streptomyces sp. NPDC101115 TaxID=3366106 RepID=UPI003814601F